MVFPSVPVYLDPPNWNQLQQSFPFPTSGGGGGAGGGGGSGGGEVPPLIPGLVAVTRPPEAAGMAAGPDSASRTVSMSERARLAKIPQPEQPLKCPRCDSSNTKFCYYNNYSLSQPRHFCKACRRYWTRGGALRNVPVGGGCRRNKRSSKSSGGSSSKSTADRQAGGGTSSSSSTATGGGGGSGISPVIPQHGQFPFVVSMPTTLGHYGAASNLGLNFGIPTMDAVTAEYQVGGNSSNIGLEQWRLPQIQQFPFLGGGLEPPVPAVQPSMSGLYHFTGEARQVDGAKAVSGSSLITQLASVKMEDHNDQLRLNFPRQYLGLSGNDQYNWSGTGGATGEGGSATSGSSWAMTDLSVFNSSSSGNNIL